ncbi:hypothetical protein CBA19CS22_00700 [Caballeronia novacaledonica]|uniref:Uncharacterized protein n=1 Tax=Caballeronia novacaledonica TaxID=1544861 RepID=A0ACB5QJZ1_9BURK|nr:hypothetical protein CBA19CS22_00700 [Caballeronia novacaledonica]
MKKTAISGAIVSFILAACGGDGGGGGGNVGTSAAAAPAPTVNEAQGIYTGKDSSNDQIIGVILDSGAYYFVYVNSSTRAVGLVQGTSTVSGGTFKSTDAKNFYIGQNTVLNETVSANYTAKSNIAGTISPASGGGVTTTFYGTYYSIYDQAPSLSSIAGTYTGAGGSVKGSEAVTVTLSADGSISGRGPSGCTFTGTASPHSGKNVYDATITFGGSNCLYPGRSLTGMLTVAENQLFAAAPLADRSDAFILVGSK